MNDELKKLEQAFRNEAEIKASEKARNAALKAAMNAYEVEKNRLCQGNANDGRLKKWVNNIVAWFTFSKRRNPMKLSYMLTGIAGLATLTLVAINTHQFERLYTSEHILEPQAVDKKETTEQLADSVPATGLAKLKPAHAPALAIVDDDLPVSSGTSEQSYDSALAGRAEPASAAAVPEEERAVQIRPQAAPPRLEKKQGRAREKMAYLSERQSMYQESAAVTSCCKEDILTGAAPDKRRDRFEEFETGALKQVSEEPVSTFSIDVDTASYGFMRASLRQNVLPPKNSVRIEEFINYFPYDYPVPDSRQQPFSVSTTVIPSPWNDHSRLLHIGIKGFDLPETTRLKSNLVFLLDTSGSMNQPNKLPLLQQSFKLLLSSLSPDDTVSIVAYAGSAGMVLEPTQVKEKTRILNALSQLRAGGSTAGGEGIHLAYQLAENNFDAAGVNRVILATDGDFNVGIQNPEELKGFVERKRDSGIFLSVLGFGMGNYNDALMQALAQNGNGNAAYIDSLSEARKVLLDEASSTLFTIANDVKIQVEFNPERVSEYRLIGYETRQLNREDFNNDKVDAGDIGAGHSVTAIYEFTPADSERQLVDPLRYQSADEVDQDRSLNSGQQEYGFLKLRYKLPGEDRSRLIEQPVPVGDRLDSTLAGSDDVRFSSAVAAYGQILRGGRYTGSFSFDDVIELALGSRGRDPYGYRAEFINLVRLAKTADEL